MITTNSNYIHQYDVYDSFFEYLEYCDKEFTKLEYEEANMNHRFEMKSFFEGSDSKKDTSEKKDGILAKVGNMIVQIIAKLKTVIESIGKKIKELTGDIESDEEIVNKMLKENPEYRNQVVEGIEKGWFTYKDIASYEKDIIGVVMLYNQKKIDNRTAIDKLNAAADKFEQTASPIIRIGSTVGQFFGSINSIFKGLSDGRKSLQNISKACHDAKDDFEHSVVDQNRNTPTSFFHALARAVGLATDECKHREESMQKTKGITAFFKKKFSKDRQDEEDRSITDVEDNAYRRSKQHDAEKRGRARADMEKALSTDASIERYASQYFSDHYSKLPKLSPLKFRIKDPNKPGSPNYTSDEYKKELKDTITQSIISVLNKYKGKKLDSDKVDTILNRIESEADKAKKTVDAKCLV